MPSVFRDPKDLPDWLELDYFSRPRGLWRRYRLLIGAALGLSLGGVLLAVFLPGGSRLAQAGPVAPGHAMFNDDCARCHREPFATATKLLPWNAAAAPVPNHACVECHDGPPHNDRLTEAVRCANCHREHRGRAALARVPDVYCTACHADLARHRKGGAAGLDFQDVHSFNDGHPEFALWRRNLPDPAKLHFNHAAHLKEEGILSGKDQRVKLVCADCHQLDAAGRYVRPINYESHCARCHPLSVQMVGAFKGQDPDKLAAAVAEFNRAPAPHEEPRVIRAMLRQRLLDFVERFPLVAGEADGLERGVPRPTPEASDRPPTEVEWQWVNRQLGVTERLLFPTRQLPVSERVLFENAGGCRFCHIEERRGGPDADGLGGLPEYAATAIRPRWMPHARFGHQSHRMLDCRECHAARQSSKTSDVLMPKIQTCQQCHSPKVGARTDCVECHLYHDRGSH